MIVPLVSWPIVTLSVILMFISVLITATVLLHKSRGGGMSDLFGGGMSTSMGGASTAERRLDRITIVLGIVWALTVVGLLVLYRIGV
ncbi:MAG TPA: preprotein translocase subunit SecG [Tessaracoccus flavescens]|uniref:Protein-export membrane protein SecG n=1 Tax=Tessaracoccus flavescens TaxID=399497 RepID=A0A921JRP2_9ACTN|nr:preprotein translocase subunit SecG [Tessaracoccus flavescens]